MDDIREWKNCMKDDPAINIHHPPPGVLHRLIEGYKKQKEKNQQPSVTPQSMVSSSTASSTVAGPGMTLNINLSGGPPPAIPLHERVDNESQDRDLMTPAPYAVMPAIPLPSSPIPQARDEDSRLFAFIQSRITARPARRSAFERARDLLIGAGVGFSDLACLSSEEWREIGIDVGIKVDLLKNDKIWHLQHPEAVDDVGEHLLNELDLRMVHESNDSEL
jgi:hypothetical protein